MSNDADGGGWAALAVLGAGGLSGLVNTRAIGEPFDCFIRAATLDDHAGKTSTLRAAFALQCLCAYQQRWSAVIVFCPAEALLTLTRKRLLCGTSGPLAVVMYRVRLLVTDTGVCTSGVLYIAGPSSAHA